MFKRFSNTRARAPCNPRRGAVFAPKWAKKFCKPALRQLAKFRVHSRSSVIKNRALVSFSALSRLFALIRPTPSAFYHSSRKLTTDVSELLREEGNFFEFFAGNEKAPLRKGGRMPFVRPPLGG